MDFYFLTFNPEKGNFSDYARAVEETRNGRTYSDTWKVKSKDIQRGDRVFVLRQGKAGAGLPPVGIMAEGSVREGSYKSPGNRDGTGKLTFRVSIDFHTVLGPKDQAIPWPLPGREYAGKFRGPFGSGDVIDDAIAGEIEQFWQKKREPQRPPFDLKATLAGEPDHVLRDIQRRQGQGQFRAQLLEAYRNRCALSDWDVTDALEAAHILRYSCLAANHVQNGLLLRADLHTLFDLHLFAVDPESLKVTISPKLRGTNYEWLHEKQVRSVLPHQRPSKDALRLRAETKGPASGQV